MSARVAAQLRQRMEEHRPDHCVGDGLDVRVGAQLSGFDGVAEPSRQPGELRSTQLLIEVLAVARTSGRRGDEGSHQCGVRRCRQEFGVLVEPRLQVCADVPGLGDGKRSRSSVGLQHRLGDHRCLRRPSPVQRLLSHLCARRDAFHRKFGVAAGRQQLAGGIQNRAMQPTVTRPAHPFLAHWRLTGRLRYVHRGHLGNDTCRF